MATEAGFTPQGPSASQAENDEDLVEASPKELKNALYARCASQGIDKLFDQDDLLAFGVIPNDDLNLLQTCTDQLTKQGLLKIFKKDSRICWKVVKKEDAAKYKNLSEVEAVVYSLIETSAREGIWTKTIRMKANLHLSTLNQSLKSLEHKSYIKSIRNVRFPSRKTYMLAHLQPSEAATGGPFYTDGILDDEFVNQMATWTERYIIGRSWSHRPHSETMKKKSSSKLTREQAEKLRAEEMARGNVTRDRSRDMLPMPPGFTGYPTVSEITRAINASRITSIPMKEAEMLQLLDILVWDSKVERIPSARGYRAVRKVPEIGSSDFENGLTEAPCGRCPVFEICEEGGPVNATTCEYFEDWLNVL